MPFVEVASMVTTKVCFSDSFKTKFVSESLIYYSDEEELKIFSDIA